MRFALWLAALVTIGGCAKKPSPAERVAQLGARIFADKNLSSPPGKSCADCHSPASFFRDPESDRSTSDGAIAGLFGFRNSPTAMYSAYTPPLTRDSVTNEYRGGLFWDGRANSLEAQAEGPLLNPIEMHNQDRKSVVSKLRAADYAKEFGKVFGDDALSDEEHAFSKMTTALAAYERSPALAPFSSKYDLYLAHKVTLTSDEKKGLMIFEARCASCHPNKPGKDGSPPLFTDFSYANLGIPKYGNSLYYKMPKSVNPDGARFVDHGLMNTTGDARQDGKFRVPTLRNIFHSPPYGHNGYFATLDYIIEFLSTRDVKPWPPAEVPGTVERARTGNLRLTSDDKRALLAFLRTLNDGYRAPSS